MEISRGQEKAIQAVSTWFRAFSNGETKQQVFRLFGYAGTGKTTLAMKLVESVSGLVVFAAYTGKAAHVLAQKGCPNASTIHKLIYIPKEKSRERLFELKRLLVIAKSGVEGKKGDELSRARADIEELERKLQIEKDNAARPMWKLNSESTLRHAKLLVVDECSMVDKQTAEDLLSFGVPILALGDPAQLPPVGGEGFFTASKPDVMLTEIHRQARDNPIIELSRIVREGGTLKVGKYGESEVIRLDDWSRESVFGADQLLVGKNVTREAFNRRYRELQGISQRLPVQGDKLVCLRNNHELGLLNGSLWSVVESQEVTDGRVDLRLVGEGGEEIDTSAHSSLFLGEKPEWYEKKDADEFTFGYALTVHKSQGSQWGNVILFDEWRQSDRQKWLYTGITRAAEKLQVVKMR